MNIAKYVLESISKEIVSILINGYNLSVSDAYNCISNSGLLSNLEESPNRIMNINYDDCLNYADKLYKDFTLVKKK